MDINKVSQSIKSQTPDFIESEYSLLNRFLEYYYKSQERTGLGQNIVNNFLQYLNIDKLDVQILDGKTKLVEDISKDSDTIVVETIDSFLEENGTLLIGDEVIFYEKSVSAPNIALSPGISYSQVKEKWIDLANPVNSFDGTTRTFALSSQDSPIAPPSAQHLIVKTYGQVLVPGTDYTVDGTNIVFTTAPRTKLAADDTTSTSITFLKGFTENSIVAIDNLSNSFGEGKTEFAMTRNGSKYDPITEEYIIAIYDNRLLIPRVDYFIDKDVFIFNEAPLNGRALSLYSIEAPIPSFGAGAVGYARVSDTGEISGITASEYGSNYRFEYPPKVTINSIDGKGAAVTSLVNGIKSVTLIDGGKGYSDTNPPIVTLENPTKDGSIEPKLTAKVENGSVTSIEIDESGSGYTFVPRLNFKQPGGAKLGTPTIVSGRISGTVPVTSGGQGYTTVPEIYVDAPTGDNGIRANLEAVLTDGQVTSINILNAGQGYETVPRIAVIDPVGAQVLEVEVDSDGRVINIDLLDGGSGYEDIPSVYVVDNRTNDQGTYIGGTGAKATAAIFNGKITDINITDFGTGYSSSNPPTIVIQDPPQAEASVSVGENEITGFSVTKSGSKYSKAKFEGCARAASGIVNYTEDGNAVFSNNTTAVAATSDTEVKCLDALFIKRLLDKYVEQFLPDVPELDYSKIDVRTSIKTIKDFYASKGTSFSIAYLFKLLYGETVSISYPKDQITKPSAATWSIDTILRATLVSGNPINIRDGLLTQESDIADPNIKNASALVENYLSIKTSEFEIFELVLSEETIEGSFTVPYKTKLAEPLATDTSIITVDSTIGWPERNGEFVIGGSEVVQYKEKSLNQFIECTRSVNGITEDWDSATEVSSNFRVYVNKGTDSEVVLNVVGIVDAQQTTLTDTGSYYLPGDKLTISKLGGTSESSSLTTWLYNVKKLIEVESITFGGVNNQSATVTCSNPHGLLVGDQVTVYGANPIIYNGSFLVTSRDSTTVFQYQLPQPATVVPQGNILVSVDLNKGKSDNQAVLNAIGPYTTNIQNTFFNTNEVYVASTGIPNYKIGPFPGSALLPGNQRKLNRFPLVPTTISNKNEITPGPIGTWINGVSVWSYKSTKTKTFGAVTDVNILNAGEGYDAASPPTLSFSGGGGTGASASVTVNGSVSEITVDNGGSGYTSSPLVSIVGGGGSGASATAIITKGVVSRVLINDGGTGYTSQPSITIVGGGGTGATGTASVRGPIKSVSIDAGGESYTSNPTVSLSSGSGAVAQAIVNNGRIISIAIISAGSGYTTAPEVTIQGDGFGAVARATIDTDGENAGRVTGITIINKGINYVQGTTVINLNSVGQGAQFDAEVFEWTYNLQTQSTFDSAKGGVFEGYNNQYGGEYAHLSNPQRLRYILGDNLAQNPSNGQIYEQESQLEHSPIVGWAFDGNPIYGPYGYEDPTDQSSEITRLRSSYRLKTNLVYDEVTNPTPVRTAGPLLSEEVAGNFVEDYEYSFGLGDLDQYNGRFCKTPDYPEGRYCYFVTVDATENGNPVFPYVLGPSFNSVVDKWNLSTSAVQQNIPTGVVRYRDPYENVDIDVERAPNASTNALTLENGDVLLFEVEDENRDGVISQDETDDPDQIFEESPLQLFDYFPKVKLDSKVDIEVDTITKFEDASVTGFTIENAGQSYQVNDRLVFDNDDTDGSGVSARVSRIKGETVESYTFENIGGVSYGVLNTQDPHNLQPGDSVFVDYTPVMDNTNKTFTVRQFKGIEQIIINQTGSGYNEDIPPTIVIDGDGESAELNAKVTTVGSINEVEIVNSGNGYTKNPRVILSHPQVFKKADYYVSKVSNNDYVKINDVFVNSSKESFICGRTKDSSDNDVAFVAKLSATGVKEWEKTLESSDGLNYVEFLKIYVDGSDVWVAGINKPNSSILNTYNPDIVLVKYEQADNGLSATLDFQKGYSGISGNSRSDNITALTKVSDTRMIIGGFTNTNSANPDDAFLATIDTSGNFAIKRKISSESKSERIRDIEVIGSEVYFLMETAASNTADDINVSFGKATIGTTVITVDWIKEYTNTLYSFLDSSLSVDEFEEFYITSTLRLKSDDTTRDSVWVGKVDADGDFIWNYRYVAPGREVTAIGDSSIDIFGDLNIGFTTTDQTTDLKTVDTIKLDYKGKIKNHVNNKFNKNRIEGLTAHTIETDNSGDIYVFGQTSWNRNEFILEFDTDATDKTGNYTPTLIGNDSTDSLVIIGDGVAKLFGKDVVTPANWENAAIKFTSASLGTKLSDKWTIEFMLYKDATNSQTHSQTQQTLLAIGDATDTTGGLWMYYDMTSGKLEVVITNNTTAINSASSAVSSTQTTMFADNSWQFIGLKKDGNTFTVYVNGISVATATTTNTSLGNKDLHFGNIPGKNGTTGQFASTYQGQYYLDNLRLRNRAVTPTVPSDVTAVPPTDTFALAFDWVDDNWFTDNMNQYDYIDYDGFGIKIDKNADTARLGDKGEQSNTDIGLVRTAVTAVTGSTLTMNTTGYDLGGTGLQTLDYDDATTTMTQDSETLTYSRDIWSSRTATVPSPGSQKLKVTAVVKDKYYFKVTNTTKIDNIQELTINQAFKFTKNTKLVLNNGSTFVNSGYIVDTDTTNNKVYLAINNNAWSNDLNTGNLSTAQFNEQSTYGVVGPIPNDINIISSYQFVQVQNTTPGTFDIDLADYDAPSSIGGTNNLDEYAKFKPYADADYSVRIDEVSGSSAYIVGSVVTLDGDDVSFNAAYSTFNVTGLTGVTKITLIANLDKILQVTAVANSDQVYVITGTKHYLEEGENIYVDGNPSRTVSSVVYDEYDGSFTVDTVVSPVEFVYKLPSVAVSDPATTAGDVSIFVKSPVLKMYYGHQYLFDLSHSSMQGGNLSFSKDNLYKLEYSFNSIERIGTPGVTGEGQPTPTVKLKVDESIVTNISYYFDPSRLGDESPVDPNSYLDVTYSPYGGTFEISSIDGATITRGADIMKFPLLNEPEGDADITKTLYSTSSEKAVGSISNIRIVNPGGFYKKLPVVTGITSNRKIERVQINEPGTEYAVGEYTSVPIGGDGEGGLVTITVADGTDAEGDSIPGQIQSIVVTSAGKGYTTATIDIDAVDGILGPGLSGSGAEVEVVIPSSGTGASIFTKGTNVGKIKNLKNNNFGYDYPHDYTLRPEITFPINAQLTSTSILDSITVTDPGSGYSQAPAVVITGGGGSGAVAEATIKNGRLEQIIVKDAGAGYSSTPTVALRSSFNYVVNLDLGLLQFAFPHGITNGAEVTLTVTDTGDGAEFPLASGALGRLNASTTYYAIAGSANSLEDDQLKLAITAANAELGDAISFSNAGTGRQSVLTESFGGAATANVITSTFLEGELVYQGDSLENATATGYVSTNSGWQIGPRILKIVDYTGTFSSGETVTGVVSKSSGVISDLKIAKGVLEIGSITRTTGQFIDDVGKPSEIIQKIQDSYYYQDFSYAVKSAVSINEWKDILVKNVHPASFKVFGELSLSDSARIANKETFFDLTKSVELAREAIVPNIQNFALVEPVYSEFNNTEVLFRQKRLTSSENILTSTVQRVDDISTLFDGVKTQFPLTVDGNNVVASADQLMIILNGVVQTPNDAFEVQGDSIVFSEPPSPPASVKYVTATIESISTKSLTFPESASSIFPSAGNTLVGTSSLARFTVTSVTGTVISGFIESGTFIPGELCTVGATGFAENLVSVADVTNIGLFEFNETITNLNGDTAIVEEINLESGSETPLAQLRYTIGVSTTSIEVVAYKTDNSAADAPVPADTFTLNENYQIGSEIVTVTEVSNGSESTTLTVTRGQVGTTSVSHQEDLPVYGTDIEVSDTLIISKTAGTYQSTPGLFNINNQDVIIGAKSGVVARVLSANTYQDPVTQEFIPQVNISDGSSFFGLLFNRIVSTTYPNVVLDDISKSQVNIVQYQDNATSFSGSFPPNEVISNYVIPYDNEVGTLEEDEFIRNYKLEYGNESGDFATEGIGLRKLTFTDSVGSGFFSAGQVIRTKDTKAEVIGYNQARSTVYLGKIGRCQSTGEDYFDITFNAGAQLNTYNKKYGTACLALSKGLSDHTFVSGVADAITAGGGATGTFTAATGTTYNPATGVLVIEIGTHTLTTSNTVTITDEGIVFTCDSDNNTNEYAYPRSTDPASGTALAITGVTATTITVSAGAVPIDESLSIASSSEFALGTGSYTFEMWVKPVTASITGTRHLFDTRNGSATDTAGRLYIEAGQVRYAVGTSDIVTSGSTTLSANTWYHIAVVRSGTGANETKLYIDGTQEGQGTDATTYAAKPMEIGSDYNDANYFAGYIDEFRISNSNRYTAAFTAPAGMFQGDSNTKLLLHFDADTNGQTHTQDWSGGESLTNDEDFNNDAILETSRVSGAPSGFDGKTHRYYDAADLVAGNTTFVAKEAVYATEQNYGSLSLTSAERTALESGISDALDELVEDLRNGSNNHMWDESATYVDRTANPITINTLTLSVTQHVWMYDKVKEMLQYIINNVLWTVAGSHGLTQFTDTTITDSSTSSFTQFTPTAATYDAATGDMVLTIGTHSLTTASRITLGTESITFTCDDDNNDREIAYPRESDPAANAVLAVTATTSTTITVNVGASPADNQYAHTFVSAITNAVTVLDYTTGDCADVWSTVGNLMDILTDTLEQADLATPVDHLGTITKVSPAIEFLGGTVDAYSSLDFDVDYTNTTDEYLIAGRVDATGRDRFKDAFDLITANASVIVDKAAHDMIVRYPDLAQDMPRNENGASTDGTLRCKTDLLILIGEIAKDIRDGGNFNTVQAAKFYLGANDELQHIRLQVFQSAYAHERLGYYAKQAITGDLTYDNTDNIIVGDWDITQDAGGCANVKTAIDTLITTLNDIIAPKDGDYRIGADRLYFNREYIGEEVRGRMDNYLGYTLNNISYFAYDTDDNTYVALLEDFIVAAISDLLTGGNNSTIAQAEKYLTAALQVTGVDDQLLAFVYAIEDLKVVGEKAIKNLLYDTGTSVTGDQYAATYTLQPAYRDSETPSDIDEVWYSFRDLIEIAVDIFSPGGLTTRNAVKNIKFNQNYYLEEIESRVNGQFGSNSWTYDSFVTELVENVSHDLITTDTSSSNTQTARTITMTSVSDDFEVGETVTSSGTGTATVLEYIASTSTLIVGAYTGTAWAVSDTLTGGNSGATATVDVISASYDWYTSKTNVKAINTARNLTSLIENEIPGTNLFTNPEAVDVNWTFDETTVITNVIEGPDGTSTAEKVTVDLTNGEHSFYRDYTLTAYTTYDNDSIKFDSDSVKFDVGAPNADTQTYTTSMFLKKGEYDKVRFGIELQTSAQNAFFDFDLTTGVVGTLFIPDGGITVDAHGAVPIGDGWFRLYMTATFSFGFTALRTYTKVRNTNGQLSFTGTNVDLRVFPSNGGYYDRFGYSIDVADGKVISGAPYDDPRGGNSGSAYIFNTDGTGQIQLIPPTGSNEYAGWDVAIGEGKAVVSSPFETVTNYRQGAVWVYNIDGTGETRVLSNSAANYEYFGQSVAIGGGKIAVGANGTSSYRGAVYIYDLDGNYETTITASDRASYDNFGFKVAIGNNKIAVSSIYDDDTQNASGSVYVYNLDGTGEVKINASDPANSDQFGRSLAIANNKVIVGAYVKNSNTGAAYVYDLDGTNEVKITASDGAANERFGYAVAGSDNKVFIAASDESSVINNISYTRNGAVYVYDYDGTNEEKYFASSSIGSNDYFGYSLAADNNNFYAGAIGDSPRSTASGAFFVTAYNGGPGIYAWGTKLTKSALDPYVAASGEYFYSSTEFNIKTYTVNLLKTFMSQSLSGGLASPSEEAGFYSYYDSTAAGEYTVNSITGLIRNNLNIIYDQLLDDTHYTSLTTINPISLPTKKYGVRDVPVGIATAVKDGDYIYGTSTGNYAEVEDITVNEGLVVKIYKRFRIDGDITDGPFTMNENVAKQGAPTVTGVVYGFHEDENYKYLDVEVTAGPWAITDTLVGAENSTTAQISAIEDRLQIINLKGEFVEDVPFRGYTSTATATPTDFLKTEASVTNNTGGTLTVDTDSLIGNFEKNAVVYPASSERYLLVNKFAGLEIQVGDRIASEGHVRLSVSIIGNLNGFTDNSRVYKLVNGVLQTDVYGIITEVDLDNNYLYINQVEGSFSTSDLIVQQSATDPGLYVGQANIASTTTTAGAGSARVQDVREDGLYKRLYLTDVAGSFNERDSIKGPDDYQASLVDNVLLNARVKRAFKGFDGTQTTFDLTIENGTAYLPDPAGHMLIFINGILQPPGATNAYTAFSDQIQFTEAPDPGSSFTGFYIGKLRQLDDISFEFDSLRQSFNLKRNDVFYSLTLTDGVQSNVIRPENNIIVSLNGVIQEPGAGFEIVGSRIIFSEIPRVGSTFVAFSYVGSEADVDAAEVVPPIETGDFIDIQGETEDREVAVIESSNSLITFDYLGSVFGQNAVGQANLKTGFITDVDVTSGGSGYTSRPTVRLDSISGFDGSIKALVGVAGVELSSRGTNYENPEINVETTVPDDWTAPNLADYGEELVDPEI